jgi:glycosyltransferase involved in cell wall biosynthesis
MTEAPAPGTPSLVSCVVIFLDAERYLAEAIDSVLAQTYGRWELILVDDGSRDASAEIARAYVASRPEQIRLLSHPGGGNRGKSASRNLGMRAAQGEFLAMLDADDAWTPEKLEEQVALLRSRPDVDMVYGPVLYWYGWTGRPLDRAMEAPSRTGLRAGETSRAFDAPTLLSELVLTETRRHETICPYPSSLLFRRRLFLATGGFDEDFQQLYDDVVFIAKAFLNGRTLVVDRVWARYRMHPDEPLSHSYQRALERGEWHRTEANAAERAFLDRIDQYVREAAQPRSAPWLRLRAILWWARARYRSPATFRLVERLDALRNTARRALRRAGRKTASGHIRTGEVRWGDFGRLQPMDDRSGFWRGTAIRRRYVADFLAAHGPLIRGRVAEVGDDVLARRFGGDRPTAIDPLPMEALVGGGRATDTYDCIIAVDVLQFGARPREAVAAIHDALVPGGAALVALPGLLPLADGGEDHWRFTPFAARALFETAFSTEAIEVQAYGNVRTATATLHGLGGADLDEAAWTVHDARYPVMIMVNARR